MAYDKKLLEEKLQRWHRFAGQYTLPQWRDIPDFGLYMDQVVVLLGQYLSFIPAPAEGKDSFVTAATINNYVRLKLMPPPVKKKYGRVHIAYLLMILTLKLSLSIWQIGRLLPTQLSEEEVQDLYCGFYETMDRARQQLLAKLERLHRELTAQEPSGEAAAGRMVFDCALESAFSSLLSGKLIALEGRSGEDGEN